MVAGEMSSKVPERSLLRAAEQLQDAIKSARRRRSSHTHVTSPRSSLYASCSHSDGSATFQDHECDDSASYYELEDKENIVHNDLRDSSHIGFIATANVVKKEPGTKQRRCERLSQQTTQSLSGNLVFDLSCLSDGDDSDDGVIEERSRYSMREWERRGILRMSELSLSGMTQPDLQSFQSRYMMRSEMDKSIGEMTRRALDWMQQDTEKQAKENKAMQELLHGVICIINDVVVDLALPSDDQNSTPACAGAACRQISQVQYWKELSIDNVDKLISEWETVLLEWRKHVVDSKSEVHEAVELLREDCDAKMRRLCEDHELERVLCEDYASAASNAAHRVPSKMNSPSLQPLFLDGMIVSSGCNEDPRFCDREGMDLKAHVKEAELRCLRWQMAFEDQEANSHQLQERLVMLLEESTATRVELQEHKARMAGMINVDTLKVYQQTIALLEDQMNDTRQQVACDHEQFLYEQRKWELEKKHLGKDVAEIQDVSVKVLKVLLIRDKMLKKQERHLEKRAVRFDRRQKGLDEQFGTLQVTTRELMQECALFLVVLQEHATGDRNAQIPVKPLLIKKMLKRLRRLQHATESPSFSRTATFSSDTSVERSSDDSQHHAQ